MKAYVADRKNGEKTIINSDVVKVSGAQVVVLQVSKSDIEFIVRQGGNLVIKLKSGDVVTIQDYFITPNNELVIDDTAHQSDGLYWMDGTNIGTDWTQIDSIDSLLIQETTSEGGWAPLAAGVALLGAGGAAVISSSSDDGYTSVNPPKTLINNGKDLSGTGVPGTTIVLTKPDGTTVTTTVDDDGNWSFGENPLDHGETGNLVTVTDGGDKSVSVDTGIADKIPPEVQDPDINNAYELSGKGEPGSTIILKLPDGSTVGTVVDKDGNWKFVDPNPLKEGGRGRTDRNRYCW